MHKAYTHRPHTHTGTHSARALSLYTHTMTMGKNGSWSCVRLSDGLTLRCCLSRSLSICCHSSRSMFKSCVRFGSASCALDRCHRKWMLFLFVNKRLMLKIRELARDWLARIVSDADFSHHFHTSNGIQFKNKRNQTHAHRVAINTDFHPTLSCCTFGFFVVLFLFFSFVWQRVFFLFTPILL